MNTLAGRIVGIVLLALVAWLATMFLPSPFGTVVGILCGVGVVLIVVFLVIELARGPHV